MMYEEFSLPASVKTQHPVGTLPYLSIQSLHYFSILNPPSFLIAPATPPPLNSNSLPTQLVIAPYS